MEEPVKRGPGRPRGRRNTRFLPSVPGHSGFHDRRHQALWRRLVPLGFLPHVLVRGGRGSRARWGASWWRISAYHPGFGIGVQITFAGDRPSRKLDFLRAHCASLYMVSGEKTFYAELSTLTRELKRIVGSGGV